MEPALRHIPLRDLTSFNPPLPSPFFFLITLHFPQDHTSFTTPNASSSKLKVVSIGFPLWTQNTQWKLLQWASFPWKTPYLRRPDMLLSSRFKQKIFPQTTQHPKCLSLKYAVRLGVHSEYITPTVEPPMILLSMKDSASSMTSHPFFFYPLYFIFLQTTHLFK